MAADCSFFHSSAHCSYLPLSTAFLTIRAPYCSLDGSRLLILPLVKVFHSLRTELLNGWQQITHPSTRQQLSRWLACSLACQWLSQFARCFAPWIKAHCLFFCSSMAFTRVYVPCCPADGSALLILPLVKGFPNVSRAAFLSGWQRITRSATCLQFSRFACCIAQWRETDCLFFASPTAFTMVYIEYRSFFQSSTTFPTFRVWYYSTHGSALLVLPLTDGFHGLRAILLTGWRRISHSSIRQ